MKIGNSVWGISGNPNGETSIESPYGSYKYRHILASVPTSRNRKEMTKGGTEN